MKRLISNKKLLAIGIIIIIVIAVVFLLKNKSNNFTVSFETAGGTKIQDQVVKENSKIIKPKDPVKEGYVFIEWQLNGTKFDFTKIIQNDIVLVAIWKQEESVTKEYTVKFNSNGGTKIQDQVIKENSKIIKPKDPVKDGYVFVEWQLNGTKFDFTENIQNDIVLVAIWKQAETVVKEYTVKFNSNGGTKIQDQVVKENSKIIKPIDPVKEGYVFIEWQLNGTKFDFTKIIQNDIVLVAIWKQAETVVKEYTVKFNSNGGTKIQDQVIKENSKIIKPKDPVKDGYVFVEWQLNGTKFDFNISVNKNIILTAKWKSVEIAPPNTDDNTVVYYCEDGWTLSGDVCFKNVDATKECDSNFKEYGEECISVSGVEPTKFCSTRMLPEAYGWEPSAQKGYLASDNRCYYISSGVSKRTCESRGSYFIDNMCHEYRFEVEKKCNADEKLILIDGNEMCYKTKEYTYICNSGLLNGQKCIITKNALH